MWEKGEAGPDCFCGNPTVVMFRDEQTKTPMLMCLFHTKAEGAMFPLPVDKHPDWPNITGQVLVDYMRSAPKFDDEDDEEDGE